MHVLDLNASIAIDTSIDFNNREQVREEIENWVIECIVNRNERELRRISEQIENTGFTEEYGEMGVTFQFNLSSENKLDFHKSKYYLDDTLVIEGFMNKEDFYDINEEIDKMCRDTASRYTKNVITK